MVPGFRLFLKICGLRLPVGARALWEDVSSLNFDPDERERLAHVEAARRRLSQDERTIHRQDLGMGSRSRSQSPPPAIRLGDLVRTASVSSTWGSLLFKLSRSSGSKRILELGTCAGLSAAYLQSALDLNGGGVLVSIEGDPALCAVARETLASVSRSPGTVIEGSFSEVLETEIGNFAPFDLAFIDGHHDPVAVRTYFGKIAPYLSSTAIVILDDIQPVWAGVRPAWNAILDDSPHAWRLDLIRMGVLRLD